MFQFPPSGAPPDGDSPQFIPRRFRWFGGGAGTSLAADGDRGGGVEAPPPPPPPPALPDDDDDEIDEIDVWGGGGGAAAAVAANAAAAGAAFAQLAEASVEHLSRPSWGDRNDVESAGQGAQAPRGRALSSHENRYM